MPRNTKNDRTHTFSNEALKKLDKIPRMERSKFVDKAVIAYPIEEKHNKESNPFTEEQQKVIGALKEEIEKIKEDIKSVKEYCRTLYRKG